MDRAGLIEVLLEARAWCAQPDNDFSWSSWHDAVHALREIDGWIEHLREGGRGAGGIAIIFLPTGPLQELALSSGWGREFIGLADRFDAAVETDRVEIACAECGQPAAVVEADGDQFRRDTFTGLLTQPLTEAARAALHTTDPPLALYALDPELAPFYCPECRRAYCKDHWQTLNVFDGDALDAIRGTCPRGHERMLDD